MKRICFATNNRSKLSEVQRMLPYLELVTLSDLGHFEELEETQTTLEGNALQKAAFIFKTYGVPCFADDTGLEVEALNGAPGVYSARYAGEQRNAEDNMTLLLKNLEGVSNRNARFRTVMAYKSNEHTLTFEGIIEGTIGHSKKGKLGFGYDPVFTPVGFSKTFAEMSMEEKNAMSHRARALQKLVSFLQA